MVDERKRERRSAALRLHRIHELLGGKCAGCGFTDWRALQVDHVDGGGGFELRKSGNKRWYYGKVLKSLYANEGVYQLLCANCNWIKRHENGEGAGRLRAKVVQADLF